MKYLRKFNEEVNSTDVETKVFNNYLNNKRSIDSLLDRISRELGISVDKMEDVNLVSKKISENEDSVNLKNLLRELESLSNSSKNESVILALLTSAGIVSSLAWLRGTTRQSSYQTEAPDPKNKWEKFKYWLKRNGIDLSRGKDGHDGNQKIVGSNSYGRTYGKGKGSDPTDAVTTVYGDKPSSGSSSPNTPPVPKESTISRYPRKPGESAIAYSNRIRLIKRQEGKA